MIRAAALAAAVVVISGCTDDGDETREERHLVYTRATQLVDGSIWIGTVDGRRMRRLVRGYDALVSPDGTKVVFHRCPWSRRGCPAHEVATLYVISASGGRPELVAERAYAHEWFPDSRTVLAVSGTELVRIDVDGGERTFLARPAQPLLGTSVSPNGEAVVFAAAAKGRVGHRCPFRGDLFVAASDGGDARRLSSEGRDSDPVWIDDETIGFAREPPGCPANPASGIWSIRADGRRVRSIVRAAPKRFAWNGYYGLQPFRQVRDRPLVVAGVRSEWGAELAVVNARSGRVRRVDVDPRARFSRGVYVDHVSRDGRYTIGGSCGANGPCVVDLYSVVDGRHRIVATGNVGGAHWNR